MKTKDLVYIGIITYLAYLLLKNKSESQQNSNSNTSDEALNNPLGVTVGNGTNGGLNLGTNMDLPNLTPTSPNGLSTEVALNSSNVTPIVRDENIPTQIFGNITLPNPYMGGSIINNNPLDVVPPVATTPVPVASTTPVPTASTDVSETMISQQIGDIGAIPIRNAPSVDSSQAISAPTITTEPMPANTNTSIGTSLVAEPIFPIKTIKAELITNEPSMVTSLPLSQEVGDEIISQCGNSFSIPNNDKESSYTNFWFDGQDYYTQTTSPLIKTIATKISKSAYIEGCKKLQLFHLQNSTV